MTSENHALNMPHDGGANDNEAPARAAEHDPLRGHGDIAKTLATRSGRASVPCRFFGSVGGCRAGDSCPFLHTTNPQREGTRFLEGQQTSQGHESHSTASALGHETSGGSSNRQSSARSTPGRLSTPTTVSRPTPAAQIKDPRQFEIDQVKRRYNSTLSNTSQGTRLDFSLVPSDPDFPFELSALQCQLTVPKGYPNDGTVLLAIGNPEMERGHQINVERGFDAIVENSTGKGKQRRTLLQMLNALDRELESFLVAKKASTLKIVANAPSSATATATATVPGRNVSGKMRAEDEVKAHYTQEQVEKARVKRNTNVRQLEARMSRLPLFSKSTDGTTYTIPIEPKNRNDLPIDLRAVRSIKLVIPLLYDLEPCLIEIPGVKEEYITTLQESFTSWAAENPQGSIFANINRLGQTMHTLLSKIPSQKEEAMITGKRPEHDTKKKEKQVDEDSNTHVVFIPRPPEWAAGADESEGSETDESFDEEDESEADDKDEKYEVATSGQEKGILMSFPQLALFGIELLQLVSLSITVKCDRCKETTDVANIKNHTAGDHSTVKNLVCRKCSNQMDIGYRMDLMHANCIRAGYLDLEGCTVVDMLPSSFIPTCSECSTPIPSPGVVSVRGDSTMAICRECHKHLNFHIPEIKFLRVSTATVRATDRAPRRKKEQLGIKTGEQLPNRGRCKHYSKSYRWFRFSCCSKVFPCDKVLTINRCHDLASDHPNEHANRMICGYCSREQNYRPEDCGTCKASLVARRGTGFWEGGKGTRDKVKMSRKDPRKYKRRPGTITKS